MGIDVLSRIFADYKVFPEEAFGEDSPLRVFQKLYPDNCYFIIVEDLIKLQKHRQMFYNALFQMVVK